MFDELKRDVFPEIVDSKPVGAHPRLGARLLDGPGGLFDGDRRSSSSSRRSRPSARSRFLPPTSAIPHRSTQARAGVYPGEHRSRSQPRAAAAFFHARRTDTTGFRSACASCCVFARQNLTVDPPFSRVDLVSCRNVLIYMSPALQERLLPVFHFALNPDGFLVLGLAESVGRLSDLFQLVNPKHKIFRRKTRRAAPQLLVHGRPMARRRRQPAACRPRRHRPRTSIAKPNGSSLESLRAAKRAGRPEFRCAAVPRPHLAVPRAACRATDDQCAAHGEGRPVPGPAQRADRSQGDTTAR